MKESEKEVLVEALFYFHAANMLENLKSTERYYVEALMNFAAKKINVELC